MGRMHSNGKGKSRSALPYKRTPPSWLKIAPSEVRGAPGALSCQQRRRQRVGPPCLYAGHPVPV